MNRSLDPVAATPPDPVCSGSPDPPCNSGVRGAARAAGLLTRRATWRMALLACGVAGAMTAAGCGMSASSTGKPGAVIDPCAERLHDICGQLLLYCASKNALPKALSELQGTSTGKLPPLVCPTSGKPYVYNPEGIKVPGLPGRVVLYDPTPAHSAMRWAVVADDAAMGQPLALHVLLLPENTVFSKAGRDPRTPG